MPFERSPVKTRNTKVTCSRVGDSAADKPDDKQTAQRTLSDSALSTSTTDNIQAAILTAVDSTLNNDSVLKRIVGEVAAKIAESVYEQLNSSLQQALADINKLKAENTELTRKLSVVSGKANVEFAKRSDELEQYQRRNNLRVFGVEEREGEDTDALVIDICRSKLGVELSPAEIDRSHRVGGAPRPSRDGVVKPRPIIVKFVSYRTRREVFTNKKKLKGSSVTIREDLTAHRAALLRAAITAHGPKNVWTTDGRVNWVSADGSKGSATWKI